MAEEGPRLRVVGDDERPEPPPSIGSPSRWWRSPAVGVVLSTVLLLGGLAVGIWFLFVRDTSHNTARSDGSVGRATFAGPPAATSPTQPTTAPATTIPATTSPVAAPVVAQPTLVPVPVAGSTLGGTASTPAPVVPTAGSVNIRLFNGFTAGQDLEVWEVSGKPVRYGTLPYAGYAAIVAHGALAASGVDLHLRFVRPGGDPSATPNPSTGPWTWNLTPTAGSSQTLVLVKDGNLHITRIDDRRAASEVRFPYVHVVPIARQLTIGGTRDFRWSVIGAGCGGLTTADNGELDVASGAQLQLSRATDSTCGSPVAGPLTLPSSQAVTVIALPAKGGRANLVMLPLG